MTQRDNYEGVSTSEALLYGRPDRRRALESLETENLRLREELRRAEAAAGEFVDFVSHELKQPMTAMQGYSKMLIMGIGGELTPTQRQFVDVIDANVERMGKLVNDLLEICRLEAGRTQLNLAPVNVQKLLYAAVVDNRAELEARHHTVEIDVAEDLPLAMGDRQRLMEVLGHLVRNACRYTPEGGHVRLVAGGQGGGACTDGHVAVEVVDTGIGLSPEDLPRVGEKFFRADHELVQQQPGNGLGLAISRHLVALHGGEFYVESEPGQGSTFGFTLPTAG
ncbi:MAG: hypothetical protein GX597_09065 [Anaerolineaceae bacterium]|nr:hypothetical protein [Anaerolineaceae bacterium]